MYVLLHIFQELAKYHYSNGDIHSGRTVLPKVIEPLKTFISNIKEAVPISAKLSIKFVKKKKAKVPRIRTHQVGILNHASSVLLADCNSNYCFLVHIALTQLRPDNITIFSNSLRKVILIELKCP